MSNSVAGILAVSWALAFAQVQDAVNFTGHYELLDEKSDESISLDITQAAAKATVSFSAAMKDGSGAAPDGDGTGKVSKKGVLEFKFTDSFGNECAGTLMREKNGYQLNITPTKVVEPRPLRFYGDVRLKKTADKPSS